MANLINNELRKAVKDFMKREKLSQKKFAEIYLNVSESYFSSMLNGNDVINLDRLLLGLKLNGCTISVSIELKRTE